MPVPSAPPDVAPAHALTVAQLCARLDATPAGLASADARRRLAQFGPNELKAPHRVSPWAVLAAQFKNVLIVILLVATALSAFLGHTVEAVAIAVIVLFAVLLGFVQEYRAERAIEALRTHGRARRAACCATGRRSRSPRASSCRATSCCCAPATGCRRRAPGRGAQPPGAGGAAHRRVGPAVEGGRRPARPGPAGRRPHEHGLRRARPSPTGAAAALVVATGMQTEFGRIARPAGRRSRPARRRCRRTSTGVGRALARAALAVVVVIVALGRRARPAVRRDAGLRHRARRRRRARGAAGRRHDLARDRRAAAW